MPLTLFLLKICAQLCNNNNDNNNAVVENTRFLQKISVLFTFLVLLPFSKLGKFSSGLLTF
jgi:hypothetical protein